MELAGKLGIPPPTPEQAAVIEAPLQPMVVVAGAGSGKSETMAGRVVWLVANGLVAPDRVLGLTFTRKAAAELAARVRKRLTRLAEVGLAPAGLLEAEPTVSTYHAYAARLVTDHALREAMEPTMRLVSPAVAWQMAARVVGRYDGPMDHVDLAPPSVTAAVLDLAGELSEHLRTPGEVREVGHWLGERLARLPGRPTLAQRKPGRVQAVREQLLPLVEAYERLKRSRETVDHGDQMALAARIADRHPEVGAIERGRFSVVLLDEYQDTSHAQLVLLRALFGGGHPVTAVGDPCQSIYGWRGASSGNLKRFVSDFPRAAGEPAAVRRLSVSFRNGEKILDVAARVQVPLREEAREVPVLVPGGTRVARGRVVTAFHETADDEAAWIADGVARMLGRETAPDGLPWTDGERDKLREKVRAGIWGGVTALQPQDIAVLARRRAQFPALRRALEARDIPVEVVGLGGLLTVPEVADLVATLRVLYEPTAGDALVRLMAGPRWRIGPADMKVLGDRARELTVGNRGGPAADDPLEQVVADMAEERGSLVDALDELPDRPQWLEHFSPLARARLPRLAHELRTLRAHAGQPLPDLIAEIERRMGLDVEVAARGGGPLTARADLDAFLDAASRFAGDSEDPTLGAFLAYLKAAESEEFGLEAGRVGETNSVKLMTVHASKGLEWPVVVVPGLSQVTTQKGALAKGSVFPATPVTNSRWTENPRKLPYSLRGDRADLPVLAGLEKDDLAAFEERCRERDLMEERRLAYVAVTRAHYLLIASGYRWGSAARPLDPSDFLVEIRDASGQAAFWAPEPEEGAVNPLLVEPPAAEWPAPPGGQRHEAVRGGADMVMEAINGTATPDPAEPDTPLREWERDRARAWARDTELLLRERDQHRRRGGEVVELPAHLTVSSLVTLASDPAALARQIRRPLPHRPAPLARRGTAFHRWLEGRWGQQRLIDDLELPGAADDVSDVDVRLAELQARFEESPWASQEPVDLEVPFETMIADRLVRGRMDAVFTDGDGYVVVDWKTGERPRGPAAKAAAVQLAAYRLAWSHLASVPLTKVGAAFHYVRSNQTVRPVDLLDAAGLIALIESIPQDR
ncbi:UvrD-helicase domain-containing protein [Sphaerisporangium sp. TRM90804]|uniref:UvrD-helicase domain-containing protein n=1 Tax=Sphaerisporangium sp. TRM90804 TaxID=3031113 RepID=UPI002447E4AC|nr:UvrD-helicase domain-containing protein [Sphaerisporangium sp. TRM90804]MDH2429816.1 UvrD-helicase domain-containing protein [Sphaerisporangium sp. TRM90804]